MNNSFYNFFKNLFSQHNSSSNESSKLPENYVNGFRDPIWDTYETDESDVESRVPHGSMFSIYSNPLEIHRFFESRFDEMEQKMNEMMREFATSDNFDHFASLFGMPSVTPAIEVPPTAPALEPSNKNIRDELLKPGFRSGNSAEERVDSDLDGRIASDEIGSLLDKKKSSDISSAVAPFSPSPPTGGFSSSSFSSSFISRTIRRPDGTIEREDIVRDGAGNEKRTVTLKSPNGEETTVTTEIPASGEPKPITGPQRWWIW
ncbi:uncharacterized protein LOC111048073 isoform X2 [Nilaparvata lugens]|uniref:uncharacterized protein LOC111048073 isoform X2 n=1 Tax=Nilaparvata lugens TaxID=108931 RepID=UPI00193D7564|nr:uncharacterized protein LOC111048073 isoform X2 [Nilaparvata lugens]